MKNPWPTICRALLLGLTLLGLFACGGGGGGLSDSAAVSQALSALDFASIGGSNSEPALIVADLVLPTAGLFDTAIVWQSSDTGLIEVNGRVHRPPANSGNQAVVLTATVSRGTATEQKTFHLTVLELAAVSIRYLYPGSGYAIDLVDTPQSDSADSQISYQLDLGAATRDVYFIFTNTSLVNGTLPPQVFDLAASELLAGVQILADDRSAWARRQGLGLAGRPDVSYFNAHPDLLVGLLPRAIDPAAGALLPAAPPAVLADQVGDTAGFSLDETGGLQISATCRKVTPADGRTLNVWVANDSWVGSCTRAHCLDQTMVDALGDKFLQAGDDNDIYQWVSNVFGAEWGPQAFANQIPVDNNITILLYDIDFDNSSNGGVLGYFWAKDNFRSSGGNAVAGSNERIMFYLDAVLFATPEGGGWDLGDHWPNTLVGTLAHELQHMIHYYQKTVLQYPVNTETWLNEMASLVTEDLVASRAGFDGPRGVSYLDGSPGSPGNISGRLPRFGRYDYLPLSEWLSGDIFAAGDDNVLNSYALSYAYGAFLLRNYAGPELMRNIVQNGYGGSDAITAALAASGFSGEDFAATLRRWGVAVLLSNAADAAVPLGYRYNSGGFSVVSYGTSTYDLGSINLYNYSYPGQSGPRIYTSLPPTDANAGLYKTSNLYYRLGSGLSGELNLDVILRKGQKLTVLVR